MELTEEHSYFICECKKWADDFQMYEIYKGVINGLTMEQIELYARPEFDYDQMREIRLGFEKRVGVFFFERILTIDEVKIYAKPEFNWRQMYHIRRGLEGGLTPEQIALFARPEFDDDQMINIRAGIEEDDFTLEEVKIYARPEFDSRQMREKREELQKQNKEEKK